MHRFKLSKVEDSTLSVNLSIGIEPISPESESDVLTITPSEDFKKIRYVGTTSYIKIYSVFYFVDGGGVGGE